MEYFINYLLVFGIYCLYIATLTGLAILFNKLFKIKDYIYRKILHLIAAFSIIPLIYFSKTYWIALLVTATLMMGVLIGLLIFERFKFYQNFFIEKRKHEVIFSFMIFYAVIALLICVFWGLQGENNKYIIYTSIITWGVGDAFACIIGKSFGKPYPFGSDYIREKSLVGSIASLVMSFITSFIILLIFDVNPWYFSVLFAFIVGIVASLSELFTPLNLDNLTVPIMIALTLYLLSLISLG